MHIIIEEPNEFDEFPLIQWIYSRLQWIDCTLNRRGHWDVARHNPCSDRDELKKQKIQARMERDPVTRSVPITLDHHSLGDLIYDISVALKEVEEKLEDVQSQEARTVFWIEFERLCEVFYNLWDQHSRVAGAVAD